MSGQGIAYIVIGLIVANVLWLTDDDYDPLIRTVIAALIGAAWLPIAIVAAIAGLIYSVTLPARLLRKLRP